MLSLTTKLGGLFAAAALAIGLAGAAPAATLSWSALPTTSVNNPSPTTSSGTLIENTAGTVAKQRLSPWQGTPAAATNVFTSIGLGFAEYVFTSLKDSASFVWGSPDRPNLLQFYRGNQLIDSIAGFGNVGNIPLPTLLATNIGDGLGFDKLRFVSPGIAFEYANLVVTDLPVGTIPVPAAGLLLLTAVGGMAALRRRKSA